MRDLDVCKGQITVTMTELAGVVHPYKPHVSQRQVCTLVLRYMVLELVLRRGKSLTYPSTPLVNV